MNYLPFLVSILFVLLLLNFSSLRDLDDTNPFLNSQVIKTWRKDNSEQAYNWLVFTPKPYTIKYLIRFPGLSNNPCTLCSQLVKINQKGICCDSCTHMPTLQYSKNVMHTCTHITKAVAAFDGYFMVWQAHKGRGRRTQSPIPLFFSLPSSV